MERLFLINEKDEMTRAVLMENGHAVEYYEDSEVKIVEGTVILGKIIEHAPSLNAWFIDVGSNKKAYLPAKNIRGEKINQGAIYPFQVVKEERGSKGMTVSMLVSVSGKYAVCRRGNGSRVSGKIQNSDRRKELVNLCEQLEDDKTEIIIRTLAEYAPDEEIEEDIANVHFKLELIESAKGSPGKVLHKPESIADSLMRRFNPETDKAYFNCFDTYQRYFNEFRSKAGNSIKHFTRDYEMFDFFNASIQLKRASMRKISLKSGATLVFDYTEAMTVIDVNSSKNISGGDFEKTALETNIEAAVEITRQIRLRNISGIIIIDFMQTGKEGMEMIDLFFRDQLKADSRYKTIGGFTSLGNYELTRASGGRRL